MTFQFRGQRKTETKGYDAVEIRHLLLGQSDIQTLDVCFKKLDFAGSDYQETAR